MAQPQLDASVIIASYKQAESTALALRALFAQKTDYIFEVIVCDDGSDLETITALHAVLADAPVPAYLAWQQDRGFRAAASRNNGIRMARGRVIIMLDGDMVPEENFVEVHTRAHEEANVIAYGQRRWRDPGALSGIVSGHGADLPQLWDALKDEDAAERLTKAREAFEMLYRHILGKAAPWMACLTCNISVGRSPLVEFDESFVGWGYEDYELFYRLNVIHGYDVQSVPADAYEIRGADEFQAKWNKELFTNHLVNGFRFYEKWAHTGLTYQQAIPRYDLDPETDTWGVSSLPVIGPRSSGFLDYVEMARRWLKAKGLYPEREGSLLPVK